MAVYSKEAEDGGAPTKVELSALDPPTLLDHYLSSIRPMGPSSEDQYHAAVRHFLAWLRASNIELKDVDDKIVLKFEKHRCKCPRYSGQMTNYRLQGHSKVRGFVHFLRTEGYFEPAVAHFDVKLAVDQYRYRMEAKAFAAGPLREKVAEAEHFAAWMEVEGRSWQSINDHLIDEYSRHDCRCPLLRKRGRLVKSGTVRRKRRAGEFVKFLIGERLLTDKTASESIEPCVLKYAHWAKETRGLSPNTIRRYLPVIEQFVTRLGSAEKWSARQLRAEFARQIERTPGSAALIATILRSFIGFAIANEMCAKDLLYAVPTTPRRMDHRLTRFASQAKIDAIIAGCSVARPVDRRDKAIVLLLARLGLRAGDIQSLKLDDIDWERGILRLRGKGGRSEALPLPQDVGEALADYIINCRPKVSQIHVFLRSLAPFTPFKSSAEIAGIVSRIRERGAHRDIPSGSHVFRHSLATNMLRQGASLEEIGTVLRHGSSSTTKWYAKSDTKMLAEIAQPWPADPLC